MTRLSFYPLLFILILSMVYSCSDTEPVADKPFEIKVHLLSDPDMLHPISNQGAGSNAIKKNIFQSLTDIDFQTLELTPILAESLPDVELFTTDNQEERMRITYTLREEAQWDNGSNITADDVLFSFKFAICPLVNNRHRRGVLEKIIDIETDDNDPLKITFITERYIKSEFTTGAEIPIIPQYLYDSEQVLNNYAYSELMENQNLEEDEAIIAFAKEANDEKWQRDPEFISGSGAYKLKEWKSGQQVLLEKKNDWWGNALKDENHFFEAYPNTIRYRVINDMTATTAALKSQEIDVMYGLKARDFVELREKESFTRNFHTFTPPTPTYSFILFNTSQPILQDKHTRQALAHLMDVNAVIERNNYGLAQRIVGTVLPTDTLNYNHDLTPYPFDPNTAKELLEKAGWSDADGDGTLDKMIDGELVDFEVNFYYNSGNEERKAVALMLQEEARKVGITIHVIPQEWSTYISKQRNHEFDIAYGSWIMDYAPLDVHQIFHSEAIKGGFNFAAWDHAEADSLIETIQITIDDQARAPLYHRLQEIIHEEAPYIFMHSPLNRIVVNKEFKNAEISVVHPGYWEAGFKLN